MKVSKDLMAASAGPLVLAILVDGESYGYGILARVRELSDGDLEWTDGLLYPLLHRLEGAGHVASRWGVAENGRRRRYYEITPSGRAEVAEHQRQWATVVSALQSAWRDVAQRATPGTMQPGVAL